MAKGKILKPILLGPWRATGYLDDLERDNYVRWLAFERGKLRNTFATWEEHTTPGYGEAWQAGMNAAQKAERATCVFHEDHDECCGHCVVAEQDRQYRISILNKEMP